MVSKNRLDSIESAKTSLSAAEIKTWDEKISQAKTPKEKTALRADFKKNYNISFSQNLVKEIIQKENQNNLAVSAPEPLKPLSPEPLVAASTDPLLTTSPEANKNNDFETVQAEVRQASINLDDLVAQQKSVEDQEKNNNTDPELAAATGKIDDDRDATVSATKDALNVIAADNLDGLSDEQKNELELLDRDLNESSRMLNEEILKLNKPDISPEEKKQIEDKIEAIQDNQLYIIDRKNVIRGIKPLGLGSVESEEEKKEREEREEKDKEIKQLLKACHTGQEFIEIFRKFPELITKGDGINTVEEYIEHLIQGMNKEIAYVKSGSTYGGVVSLLNSVGFVTRRADMRFMAARMVMNYSGDEALKKELDEFLKAEELKNNPSSSTEPASDATQNSAAIPSFEIKTGGAEPSIEPTTVPNPENENKNTNAIDKFREFNISKEDLEAIKEFSDLSEGEREIVFEGLKQMSLLYVKDTAKENVDLMRQEKMRDITGDMGLGKRIGLRIVNAFNGAVSNLTKKYNIADQEKKLVKDVKRGGIVFHSEKIAQITNMISALYIDVEMYRGKAFVNYLHGSDNYSEHQNRILDDFNFAANTFRKVPADWALATASKENREKYEMYKEDYESMKVEALNTFGVYHSELNTLLEIQKVDSQVKMMQTLTADPRVNEEFEKIEKQSLFRKTLSSEAAARGSYVAGGFVTRHSLAGVIGFGSGLPLAAASFAAMPFAAAGIGAWRAHDRAKTSLNEKDILGRRNDNYTVSNIEAHRKYLVWEMNEMVPTEYSATPLLWYDNIATEDQKKQYDAAKSEYRAVLSVYEEENEKTRDKTAKNFSDSDSLTHKLFFSIDKLQKTTSRDREEYLTNLHYLKTRIQFTEDKLADGLVNFGKDNELVRKLELIQAISEARKILVFNKDDMAMKEKNLFDEKEKESTIIHDMQARFEKMFNLKYVAQDKQIESERKKYVRKQMLYGAGIGATFAIGGVILRELAVHFGIIGGAGTTTSAQHQVEQPSTDAKASALGSQDQAAADSSDLESNQAVSDTTNVSSNVVLPKIKGDSIPTEETGTGTSVAENTGSNRAGSTGIENFSNDISAGDSVWRSTREIFKNHAEDLGYKGDLEDAAALSKWAETQTANTLHNTGEFTDKVFEGNKILLEKNDAGDFVVKIEAGTGATPGFSEAVESLEKDASAGTQTETVDDELAETLKFQPGTGDSEVIPESSKPINFPEFFKHGNEATLTQIEKLGWKVSGNNLDYGGKNVIAFDDATKEIKITGDGSDGTRLLIIDKDGSMQGLQKLMGEFREVDMKTGRIIGSDATEVILKAPESASSETSVLASQNGFASWKGYIVHEKLHEMLSGRETTLDFKNNTFEYEWNGEKQSFTFQPGEAARANIEKFLAERGQIEKLADGIQNNLMTGKMKSFSALQNQLEEMNGATKLTEGEKNMWREIYADNFAKKSSSLLDDGQKLKVLRSAMNTFLSGGAK